MIREKNLDDTVSMPGAAPLEQVAKAMREAKVYVIASNPRDVWTHTRRSDDLWSSHPLLGSNLPARSLRGRGRSSCDPSKPEEIAEKLHQLAEDKTLQQELREKGFERVEEFRWEKSAGEVPA